MPQKAIPDLALQTWGPRPRTAEMRWVTRGEDSLDQEKRVVVYLTLGHSDSNERKELINLCRIKFI